MSILHRYLLSQFLKNLLVFTFLATTLLLLVDFFDRIDNIAPEDASIGTTLLYFAYKTPFYIHVMLPTAVLIATLFTFALLAKNSEITAMRCSGLTIFQLMKPILLAGLGLSLIAILMNETLVPYSSRRASEIYNLDIRKKDKSGLYSQSNFWWRTGKQFYSVDMFDSRTNTMLGLSQLTLSPEFSITKRIDAAQAGYVDQNLGWNMESLTEYDFSDPAKLEQRKIKRLPLPIAEPPEYFYDVPLETEAMGYRSLRKYIKKLAKDGISTTSYQADLHAKLAFPFVNFIVILATLPFALKPARGGNLAASFMAGVAIGFAYYVVHSFSLSLGEAELLNPMLSAWMANLLLGFVGIVLNWGAEAP